MFLKTKIGFFLEKFLYTLEHLISDAHEEIPIFAFYHPMLKWIQYCGTPCIYLFIFPSMMAWTQLAEHEHPVKVGGLVEFHPKMVVPMAESEHKMQDIAIGNEFLCTSLAQHIYGMAAARHQGQAGGGAADMWISRYLQLYLPYLC